MSNHKCQNCGGNVSSPNPNIYMTQCGNCGTLVDTSVGDGSNVYIVSCKDCTSRIIKNTINEALAMSNGHEEQNYGHRCVIRTGNG